MFYESDIKFVLEMTVPGAQKVTNRRGYRWKRINILWNKGEDFFCFSCIFQKKVVPLRAD